MFSKGSSHYGNCGACRPKWQPIEITEELGLCLSVCFKQHINKLCAICYYHLKDLRRIRWYLNADSAVLLANAMVTSRLDYCNSLPYGINKSSVGQLQKVQIALCRFIFNLDRKCHVSPYLERLHWLPVHYRSFQIYYFGLQSPKPFSASISSLSH